MKFTELASIIKSLDEGGIDPEKFHSLLTYAYYMKDKKFSSRFISSELGISKIKTQKILNMYQNFQILSKDENLNKYKVNKKKLDSVKDKISWLVSKENREEINKIMSENLGTLKFLYMIPKSSEDIHGNLTGEIIDLISNTKEELKLISPFFDFSGIKLIINSLKTAIDNGTKFRIVTRNIIEGNQNNKKYLKRLIEQIEESRTDNIEIYEFNKNKFPNYTLHSKALVFDNEKAYIGSTNITDHSLRKSFETGVLIDGEIVRDFNNKIESFIQSKFIDRVQFSELEVS